MLVYRFQDTIYGRELARRSGARRLREGKELLAMLKELYADHVPEWKVRIYGEEAGLVTASEALIITDYVLHRDSELSKLRK